MVRWGRGLCENLEGIGSPWHNSPYSEPVIHLTDVLESPLLFHLSGSFLQLATSKRHFLHCKFSFKWPHWKEYISLLWIFFFFLNLANKKSEKSWHKWWYCITGSGANSNQAKQQVIISWLVKMTRFFSRKKCQRVCFSCKKKLQICFIARP